MGETKTTEWGGFILFFLIFALVFGGGKELKKLHRIGDGTVEKIIKGKPYKSVGEIYEKGYVGAKTFDKIKNEITVEE